MSVEGRESVIATCPHCGEPAEYSRELIHDHISAADAQSSGLGYSAGSIAREKHTVRCTNKWHCYARQSGSSERSAIANWNRRATPPDHALRDALGKLVEDDEKFRDHVGGCTDGGCFIRRPGGMHTNGGCRCSDDRLTARRMIQWAWQVRTQLRTLLAQPAAGTPTTEEAR